MQGSDDPLAPVVGQAMATVESVTGAIRDSAQILYIAKANGIVADDDLKETRDRFARDMLSTDGNGTSLAVYPAANLLYYVPAGCRVLLIDPKVPQSVRDSNIEFIETGASEGVRILKEKLKQSK